MRVRNGQRLALVIAAKVGRPQQMRPGSGSPMGQGSRDPQNSRGTDDSTRASKSMLQKHCGKRHQPRDTAPGCTNAILKPALHLLAWRS